MLAAVDHTRPAWAAQLSPNGAATLLQSGAELSFNASTILSVDDDEGQQLIVQSFFGSMGFRVDVAMSGEQALALLDKGLPDVVLLDFDMSPGMSGYACGYAVTCPTSHLACAMRCTGS